LWIQEWDSNLLLQLLASNSIINTLLDQQCIHKKGPNSSLQWKKWKKWGGGGRKCKKKKMLVRTSNQASCVAEDEKSRRPEADSSDPRASEDSAATRDQWRRRKAQNWTELSLLH
jgi:hypothetical protein